MQESYKVVGTITKTSKPILLEVQGQSVAGIQISGTFSGTLQFEGTIDGTNWAALIFEVPSTGVESSSATAAGLFIGSVAGLKAIRVRASALASGSVNVSILSSISGSIIAKLFAELSKGAGTTDSTTLRVITASDGPLNTAIGSTADAAVSTDTTGTISGKLRGLVKILADVWDSTLHSLGVNMVTALSRSIDSVTNFPKGATPVNLTASGQILAAAGQIVGFYVNSTTAGTVRISDALTATTPYLGAAATPLIGYHAFPTILATGGYVTITGTIDVTFFVIAA